MSYPLDSSPLSCDGQSDVTNQSDVTSVVLRCAVNPLAFKQTQFPISRTCGLELGNITLQVKACNEALESATCKPFARF